MNKLILSFLLVFFFAQHAFLQTVEDDFEGNGTIETWKGDDCQLNVNFSNPLINTDNGSATVLEYSDQGGTYANIRFDVPVNFDLSTAHTFSMKVYVPSNGITGNQTNQVSLKLQDGLKQDPWMTQTEIIKPIVLNQWQTITFDFKNDAFQNFDPSSQNPIDRTDFNRVLIQVNGENNNDLVKAYIDDFWYDGTIDLPNANPNYNKLVWSDEFETDGAINPSKWHHQTQLPNSWGWYNSEVQHYTDRMDNSFVEDGKLHIKAIKENYSDQGLTTEYTSARLNSKFAFTYGKVEVRAKLPIGGGTWPAIWMLGKNINEDGGYWDQEYGNTSWPECGEIDIMEHWGNNQNYVSSAIHTPSSYGATFNYKAIYKETVSTDFHIYSLVWTPKKLEFSFDGAVFYTYEPDPKNLENWPFIADQYLLLNVAMQPPIINNFAESSMIIDYVRVYQEGDNTTSTKEVEDNNIQLFPNPVQDRLQIQVEEHLVGATATVYSSTGQVMGSFIQEDIFESIDMTSYPAGLYLVYFEKGAMMYTSKILKQ